MSTTSHVWRFRDDIPVRDFGTHGISTYECRHCIRLATNDPFTGEVSCDEPCDMSALDDQLDTIQQQCLHAVLAGGQTWERFKADTEQQTGLTWPQIKTLLDQRHANKAPHFITNSSLRPPESWMPHDPNCPGCAIDSLLAELEQAEKDNVERMRIAREVDRELMATIQKHEARLAKVPALVDAIYWAIDWLEKSGDSPQPNSGSYLRDVLAEWERE